MNEDILEQNMVGRPPKFSEYDADEIISDILNYKYNTFYEIAKKYKCHHMTIRNLLNRIYSRQLTQHYSDEELEKCISIVRKKGNNEIFYYRKLPGYTRDYIKNELKKGTLPDDISKVTGVSKGTISSIKFRMNQKVKDIDMRIREMRGKLNNDVYKIISDILNYKYNSYNEIAKEYKCSHKAIYRIINRISFKNLTRHYSDEELEKCRSILNKQVPGHTRDYIKNELKKGAKWRNISKATGVSTGTIGGIKFRMKHKVKDNK